MEQRHKDLLLAKRLEITSDLRFRDIRPHLVDNGILTGADLDDIENKETPTDEANALLDILPARGPNAFTVFRDALKDRYPHLARVLQSCEHELPTDSGIKEPRVFIIHAGEDKESFVRPLVTNLKQKGLAEKDIFFDEITIKPGDIIRDRILTTLSSQSLELAVLVVSTSFLNKPYWPKLEFETCLKNNKRIFPIWLNANDDKFKAFSVLVGNYSPTLKQMRARRVQEGDVAEELPNIATEVIEWLSALDSNVPEPTAIQTLVCLARSSSQSDSSPSEIEYSTDDQDTRTTKVGGEQWTENRLKAEKAKLELLGQLGEIKLQLLKKAESLQIFSKEKVERKTEEMIDHVYKSGLHLVKVTDGCAILHLIPENLTTLESFWSDYRSGKLSIYFSDCLLTREIRTDIGEDVMVRVIILEEQYRLWKKYFNETGMTQTVGEFQSQMNAPASESGKHSASSSNMAASAPLTEQDIDNLTDIVGAMSMLNQYGVPMEGVTNLDQAKARLKGKLLEASGGRLRKPGDESVAEHCVPGDTMEGEREGKTAAPLHWAARNGHPQIVSAMLAAGVGVNSPDSMERTPLHEASVNGQHETVQALLVAGADVNARDIAHITPLHDAATKGHHETVRALLVAFADVNAKDLEQSTPLHMAAGNDNIEAVKALLKAGGDVNARDTEQRTPLHLAARNGCHETVRALLMSHGVDVNAVTNQQWTPLHLAAMNGHHKTASVLLTANAESVNARDEEQKTPLHLAAWNGDSRTVSVLLMAGADVNVQDKWCNIPIREAEKRGHSGCVEAIQKADEDSVNKGPKQKRGFDPVLVHFYEQRGMISASGKDPLIQEAAKQTGKSVDQVKNFIGSYRRSKGLQRKRKPPEEDSSNTVAKKSSLTAESTNMLESASASHSAASGTWQGLNIAPATEEHWKEGEPLHTATLAGKHGPAVDVMAAGASVSAQTDQGAPNVVVQQHVHHHLYYHQSTTQQADVSSHTGAIASQGAGEAVKGKALQEVGGQDHSKSVEVLQLHEPEKGAKKTRFIGNYRWSKGESKQKPPTDVSSDTAKNESTSTGKSTSADLTSPAAASSSRPMLNTGSIRDQKERERKEEALRGAAEKGQTTGVMQLLAEGINPNAAGGRLKSVPLHEAAMYGHPKCVEVLLKHGADVYARNEKGLSAKDIAKSEDTSSIETGRNVEEIIRGRKEVLRLLLEETSKITQRKKESQAVLIRFYEEKGMTEVKKDCPLIHTAAEESGRTVEQVKRFINHRKKREDSGKRPPEPADTHSPGDSLGRVSRDTGDQGSYGHLTERGKTTTADSTSDHGQVLNTGSAMDEKEHEMKEKELCEAAENGDTVKVKQLLEQGVSIHATSGCLKRTPLHLSAENGHYNTVIALLAARATVNTQDVVQRTALHMAAVNGYHNIAKALLEAGATVNARADQQWTPVHLAAMNGHPETVSILYLAGADVNSRDEEERIPLHMAAQNGYQETVSVLLKAGSNVNIKNNEEKTSMHLAAMNGHHETVTLLAAAPGADVNSQDNKQMTPLHWAARNDDYETASALLAVDADVNARDKEKSVPLHEAAIHGHPKCVEVLLQHGADVYVRNETGLSAKDIAKDADSSSIGTRSDRNAEEVIRGRKEILKLLKEETNRMSQRKKESQAVLVRFYEEKGMTEVKKDCPLIQAAANESGRTVEQVKSFINYRKRKGKRPLQPDDNPGDTAGADDAKKAKTEDARAGGANGRGKSGGSSQRTEMFMKVSSTDKFEKLKYLLEVKIEDDVRSETYNRLVRHVAESGLCFRDEVPGDGNCMFHAVADQLFCKDGKSISHLDLRKQAVNFLRENPHNSGGDHLSAFVPEGNWDKYLDDMSRDGTWGDHIVLQAMADMLGHDISIVSSVETENYVTILTPNSRTSSVVGPPLLLGHYAENHYASLSSEATGSGTDRGTASQGPLQPAQAAISVLLVNDEYGTSRGGISTMNRQVARLLLANDAKVYGTALTATEDDKRCATKDGLNLLLPVCDDDQRTPTLDWLTYYSREHFPTIPRNLQYIFGHVDVTSKAAKNIKEKRCQDAKLVLFNHEMPEDTRYYKATKKAMRAADKETRIVEDAKSADAVFSVGSRLYSHFETEYKSLEDSEPRHHYLFLPRASQVFVETNARPGGGKKVVLSFGRVCEVTAQKGHDMAARSIGYAAEKIDNMSWVVRGVAEDVGDWEKSKKILEKKMQSRKIKPILRPYGTQQELAKDIKGAHLVLMTSRSEPFGLVGLEAIAAGIPVLISDQSGLADMIKDLIKQDKCHADLRHRIVKTSVKESDVEETARRWAEKIEDSLEYSTEEFKKAAEFKKKLLGSKYWEESHKDLLRFCGLIE